MLIVGAVLTMVTQLIQKYYKVSARVILFLFAAIIGIAYHLFVTFVPQELQATTIQFVTGCMGTAVFVYEYLIKIGLRNDVPSLDIKAK